MVVKGVEFHFAQAGGLADLRNALTDGLQIASAQSAGAVDSRIDKTFVFELLVDDSHEIGAEGADLVGLFLLAAEGEGRHGDDGGDADDDAEHGQECSHLVGEEAFLDADAEQVGDGEAAALGGVVLMDDGIRIGFAGARDVFDDLAVGEGDFSRALIRELRVMGDHDDRMSLLIKVIEDLHDFAGRHGVKIAGRFVGEKDVRIGNQRAGDGDSLQLSAGQLFRMVAEAFSKAELFGENFRLLQTDGLGDAAIDQWQRDVFDDVQVVEQIELLEDEADVFVAEVGEPFVRAVRHALAVDFHDAVRRNIKQSKQMHQR